MTKRRGNGEGSISRHPKRNLWMARYTVETPAGTKRRTVYGKTRAEVRDELAKALADRADGIVFDDENTTVEEYLEGWLKGSVRGSVRDSTYDCYKIICRKHITSVLGGLKLSKLTAMHVQRFYRDRLDTGLAPATVHKCHTVLHKALKQAVEWTLVPRNVADAVKAPRPAPRKEMHPLSPEEAPAARSRARRPARSPLRACRLHRDEGGRTAGSQVGRRGPRSGFVAGEAHAHPARRQGGA